jgi:hypothetical protein
MTSPYPPPYPQPTPPPKRSKVGLWIGILIGAVMPFVGFGLLWFIPGGDLATVAGTVAYGGTLVTGVVLLVPESTRWWGVGLLIGFFGMLIVGAGVCLAIVAVLVGSYAGAS